MLDVNLTPPATGFSRILTRSRFVSLLISLLQIHHISLKAVHVHNHHHHLLNSSFSLSPPNSPFSQAFPTTEYRLLVSYPRAALLDLLHSSVCFIFLLLFLFSFWSCVVSWLSVSFFDRTLNTCVLYRIVSSVGRISEWEGLRSRRRRRRGGGVWCPPTH